MGELPREGAVRVLRARRAVHQPVRPARGPVGLELGQRRRHRHRPGRRLARHRDRWLDRLAEQHLQFGWDQADGGPDVESRRSALCIVPRRIDVRISLRAFEKVIPISSHQDTVGPMCRTVADAAVILSAIAGRDPLDDYTLSSPAIVPDYTKALKSDGLKGTRLGVPRKLFEKEDANVVKAFDTAVETIRALGATVVDPADLPEFDETVVSPNETVVLRTDFKVLLSVSRCGFMFRYRRPCRLISINTFQNSWKSLLV